MISTDVFKTEVVAEKTQTPVFNYKMLHSYDKITQNLLEYLMTTKVTMNLFRSSSKSMVTKYLQLRPQNQCNNSQRKKQTQYLRKVAHLVQQHPKKEPLSRRKRWKFHKRSRKNQRNRKIRLKSKRLWSLPQ